MTTAASGDLTTGDRSSEQTAPKPVVYDVDNKGTIQFAPGKPFDGEPVLIKLSSGWCEAWWDGGRTVETQDGTEHEGFQWVCMDDDFQAELDDARFWMPLPETPSEPDHRDASPSNGQE